MGVLRGAAAARRAGRRALESKPQEQAREACERHVREWAQRHTMGVCGRVYCGAGAATLGGERGTWYHWSIIRTKLTDTYCDDTTVPLWCNKM